MLFDASTQKWTELAKIGVGWVEWSHKGDYVYFLGDPAGDQSAGVFRVRISDHKLEQVASLKDFRQAPVWESWTAPAPDGFSPPRSRRLHAGYLRPRLAASVIQLSVADSDIPNNDY